MGNEAIRACCLLLLLLQSVKASPNGDTKVRPIRIFTDHLLAESQRIGSEFPGLGRVQMLDTAASPKSPVDMETSFNLFSGSRSVHNIQYKVNFLKKRPHFDLDLMRQADFQPHLRTFVMIHGYMSTNRARWIRNATQELIDLFEGEVNVIQVSWADSNKGRYSQAVANTKLVARQIVIFLHYLAELKGIRLFDKENQAAKRMLHNLHLVGHSLGAHIAGFVGQDLGGRVGRITGLDPAGPSFHKFSRSHRLDRSQAQLVEVLHTNMGRIKYMKLAANAASSLLKKLAKFKAQSGLLASSIPLGIEHQLGHIDVYANDGYIQPGCPRSTLHHKRATEIYVDVLRRDSAMRKLAGAGNPSWRLLAFKAPTYESFQWGANLVSKCFSVVDLKTHLNITEVSRALPKCAIPLLDFMTPTSQLISEYRDRFGIDFEPNASPGEQPRYHFATTKGLFALNANSSASKDLDLYTQNRLMGDHYLAKIYLDSKPTWPQFYTNDDELLSACSFRLILAMRSRKELISVELDRMPTDFSSGKLVLALPFIHPDGLEASDRLDQLQDLLELGESGSKRFENIFRSNYPTNIILSLSQSGQVTFASAVCSLSIKNIEVQPLRLDARPSGQRKNLAALYGRPSRDIDSSLPVLTVSQLASLPSKSFELDIDSAKPINSSPVKPIAALTAD